MEEEGEEGLPGYVMLHRSRLQQVKSRGQHSPRHGVTPMTPFCIPYIAETRREKRLPKVLGKGRI
jgi:hypothetical protein